MFCSWEVTGCCLSLGPQGSRGPCGSLVCLYTVLHSYSTTFSFCVNKAMSAIVAPVQVNGSSEGKKIKSKNQLRRAKAKAKKVAQQEAEKDEVCKYVMGVTTYPLLHLFVILSNNSVYPATQLVAGRVMIVEMNHP